MNPILMGLLIGLGFAVGGKIFELFWNGIVDLYYKITKKKRKWEMWFEDSSLHVDNKGYGIDQ